MNRTIITPCPDCWGTGKTHTGTCGKCGGTGQVEQEVEVRP